MKNANVNVTNTAESKTYLFEQMPANKAVVTMAIPSIVGTLVNIIYNLTDTFFVGRLNNPDQVAAVTQAGNIILLFFAVNNFFGVGGTSLQGRALGSNKKELAQRCCGFCIWGTVAVSIAFSIIYQLFSGQILTMVGAGASTMSIAKDYLFYCCTLGALPSILSFVLASLIRTEGYAMQATLGTTVGAVVNIILDPLFIMPQFLNMGAAGAGLATLIGNLVTCIILLLFIRKNANSLSIRLNYKYFTLDSEVVKDVSQVGMPTALQNIFNVCGIAVLNRIAASYGTEIVAAIGIAYKLYMMPMFVIMATTQCASPLISYCFGKKNNTRLREVIHYTGKVVLVFTVVASCLGFYFSENLVHLFMDVPAVVENGGIFLGYLVVCLPFLALDFLGVAVYQAIGKGKICLAFALARKLLLEIPLLLIGNILIGKYILGLSPTIAETILAISTIFVLRSLYKKDLVA